MNRYSQDTGKGERPPPGSVLMGAVKKIFGSFLILLLILSPLTWLVFGERGLVALYRKTREFNNQADKIRQLAEENRRLRKEVDRLRSEIGVVESLVRKEWNLVKGDEILFRFKKRCESRKERQGKASKENDRK